MFSKTASTQLASWLPRLLCLLGLSFIPESVFGQGCVIARGSGGAMILDGTGFLEAKDWQLTVAHRWFRSDRHFVGDDEQKHRKAQGTQVVNSSHFLDVTATYALSKRLNLNLTLPFSNHDRSSLYEHQGNSGQRYHTQASGLGDIRVGANYWLFNPDTTHRGNLSVGFSIKAPTGEYTAKDTFMRPAGPTIRYVDSSIQPGDGGWGFSLDLQGFYHLFGTATAYGNASYLFNPKERVAVTRFSVPDSYLARGGVEFGIPAVKGLGLSIGGRIEGVPGNDAIGGSLGSRRPGFSVAVEPGISFAKGRFVGTLTVPIAVHHRRSTTFGSSRPGDAAFADYTINSSVGWRF
jgi:hypothetical protein